MKGLGYLLLCAGFIGAAYSTALDVESVNWQLFVLAAVTAVIGVVLFKQQEKARAQSDAVLATNRTELLESIDNLVRDLHDISANGELHGNALRERIDEKLRPDLIRFVDARESMVHLFGLQTYADIMSHFAAGERYVNRVWSSSADGYDEEAATYLKKAATQFEDAQQQLAAAAEAS
jgi:hypothetical protein